MKDVQSKTIAAGLAAVAMVGFSACSSNKSDSAQSTSAQPPSSSAAPAMTGPSAAPASDLIGSGCAGYAAAHPDGPASVAGMAQDPVATAASNNPLLSTLTSALSGKLNPQVNLVDTLNNGQYTVFAPTNDAFAKLPQATLEELKTNADKLKSILTYHVVQDQASPAKVDGMHKTLQGAEVNVVGQGNDLKVNDAGLVCGGVHTANATVYMIDTVLVPPSQ
ncbi:fasciclin domain-containing protein [Candidatus Mycobacterium wuenschmannii]|uniref:Fasciclin domain-containing protein n=1 Tax=Candidatus Mycobacterium wuenschmannii TaxID=3027808 RepID=A0ABY8VUG1_9MYCO|nr:fasciclin domain-containing protein [Candidatus Mycobacterium wuenschmannii]WIM87274.1 fasciclin domain-containing protein [Candidatus Mycobacterium wuenschmannii]